MVLLASCLVVLFFEFFLDSALYFKESVNLIGVEHGRQMRIILYLGLKALAVLAG